MIASRFFSVVLLGIIVGCSHTSDIKGVQTSGIEFSVVGPPSGKYMRVSHNNGIKYASGFILVRLPEDTLGLTEWDFRIYNHPKTQETAKTQSYKAHWPVYSPWDELPSNLIGLSYIPGTDSLTHVRKFVGPPQWNNAVIREFDGQKYWEGVVYLKSADDTIGLREWGFRTIEKGTPLFEIENTVPYNAYWPLDLPWDDLPTSIVRLYYWKVLQGGYP
jgi:hypothetical protein